MIRIKNHRLIVSLDQNWKIESNEPVLSIKQGTRESKMPVRAFTETEWLAVPDNVAEHAQKHYAC